MSASLSGGCQCGAVRYSVDRLGKASVCHCRMCQKAGGSLFMALVDAEGFRWTRGTASHFASSNLSNRGFCARCGTPLTLETDDHVEVLIGSLDNPDAVSLSYQCNLNDRRADYKRLSTLPLADEERTQENDRWNARITSHQHPDHETTDWNPR
ncbi:MAG: GFA family protein [Pseudomonadota bacterium]